MAGEGQTEQRSRGGRLAAAALIMLAAGGGAWLWFDPLHSRAAAPKATVERAVAVLAGKAERKDVPFRVEALGTVESMVTVPVRSRVAGAVEAVMFADGAGVKAGDVLFDLDSRVIDADIAQAEATLARDRAQLEKANRDVERYAGLATRAAVSQVTLDDARTAAMVAKAAVAQGEASLAALKVQRGYYEIKAPASGRIGVSSVRPGAVISANETLATVRQIKPIYVAFGLPARYLTELRGAGEARVRMRLQGTNQTIDGGRVAVIDNTVDPQTGTLTARAIFDNADEQLWPGTLGAVSVTLRTDANVVTVPSEAVQAGQSGPFVFIVDAQDHARMRPVTVARTSDGESVISKGLEGGETVVLDGQLSLRPGSKVQIKPPVVAGS